MLFSKVTGNFSVHRNKESAPINMKLPHYHDHYELYYLLSGNRKYFINDSIYPVKKGDVILIGAGDLHRTISDASLTHERFLINFTDGFIDRFLCGIQKEELLSCFQTPLITVPVGKREYFKELLFRMEQEFLYPEDLYARELCGHYFMETLLVLNRLAKNQTDMVIDIAVQEEKIQKAARYICQNFRESLTLKEVADRCFMSETYFSKRFKAVTGFGFSEYLNHVRIKNALHYLSDSHLSVTEIAFLCGYKDSNYFGDVFRKLKGISPTKYRKKERV